MFSVQVVNLDHYLSEAGHPVIRVFGSTQEADTCLVHIHGVSELLNDHYFLFLCFDVSGVSE